MLNINKFILSSFLALVHPFFVSVIDMKHNAKDKNLEISIRVFTDDVEAILKKDYHTALDLSKSASNVEVNKNIALYIQSKLAITIDGKGKSLHYIGYEIQKESTWIYVEVNDVATIKKMNVNCSLLFDYQDKQTNICNVKANGVEKNYKLDYPKNNVEFVC
jgi:hypothetical protein